MAVPGALRRAWDGGCCPPTPGRRGFLSALGMAGEAMPMSDQHSNTQRNEGAPTKKCTSQTSLVTVPTNKTVVGRVSLRCLCTSLECPRTKQCGVCTVSSMQSLVTNTAVEDILTRVAHRAKHGRKRREDNTRQVASLHDIVNNIKKRAPAPSASLDFTSSILL